MKSNSCILWSLVRCAECNKINLTCGTKVLTRVALFVMAMMIYQSYQVKLQIKMDFFDENAESRKTNMAIHLFDMLSKTKSIFKFHRTKMLAIVLKLFCTKVEFTWFGCLSITKLTTKYYNSNFDGISRKCKHSRTSA